MHIKAKTLMGYKLNGLNGDLASLKSSIVKHANIRIAIFRVSQRKKAH